MFVYFGIMPLQINSIYTDSASTHFRILGGLGKYTYIHQGCGSETIIKEQIPFGEIYLTYDKKKEGTPYISGINAGYILTREAREKIYADSLENNADFYLSKNTIPIHIIYLNPFVNTEWKYFAFGLGLFGMGGYKIKRNHVSDSYIRGISLYTRLGNLNSFYMDASIFHTPPLFSGNLMKMGCGIRTSPKINLWLGVGAFPYDRPGLTLKGDYRVHSRLNISTLIRYGYNEGIPEGAISFGLIYGFKDK